MRHIRYVVAGLTAMAAACGLSATVGNFPTTDSQYVRPSEYKGMMILPWVAKKVSGSLTYCRALSRRRSAYPRIGGCSGS